MFIQSLTQPQVKVEPYCMRCWANDIAKRGRVPGLTICKECEAKLTDDERDRAKAKNPRYRLWLACEEENKNLAASPLPVTEPKPRKTRQAPQFERRKTLLKDVQVVRYAVLKILSQSRIPMNLAALTAQVHMMQAGISKSKEIHTSLTKMVKDGAIVRFKQGKKPEQGHYHYRLTSKGYCDLICFEHNAMPGAQYLETLKFVARMGGSAILRDIAADKMASSKDVRGLLKLGFLSAALETRRRYRYGLTPEGWALVNDLQDLEQMEGAA